MSVFAEFLVPLAAHPPGEHLAGHPGVSVDLERIVPVGGATRYLWIAGEGRAAFLEELRGDPSVRRLATVDELPDRVLVRCEWERSDRPFFEFAGAFGGTPVDMHADREGWTIHVRFPNRDSLAAFYETSREEGVDLAVRGTYEPDGTDDRPFGLTDLQRETLAVAFEAGYFDVPRRTTLAELADRLGVSEQAVSERLRRGLVELLATVFDDDP